MENCKLVICDIDNTLVVKHEPLTKRAKAAIQHLKEKGILFGLASGRSVSQLHDLEEQWGIQCDILIGMNGSEIYDGIDDEERHLYMMKPEWIKQCLEIMSPFHCNPSLFRNGVGYVRYIDEGTASSRSYLKNQYQANVVKDDSEFWKEPAVKIGFRVSAEDMPAIEKRVAQFPSEDFKGFKTENTMFEFCHAKASKGELLIEFCQQHNIDMNTVWSFGDMTNDISMLEVSVGVCMLNGSDDAKAVSKYITEKTIAEDGWADFVEKHLL